MPTTSSNHTFSINRYIRSFFWVIGLLLFLLPFVEIKLNGQRLGKNTGLRLATGKNFKIAVSDDLVQPKEKDSLEGDYLHSGTTLTEGSEEGGKLYYTVLAAFIAGIGGLLFSLAKRRPKHIELVAGVAAALLLLSLIPLLKNDIGGQSTSMEDIPILGKIEVTAAFTLWYWLCIVSFLVAAALSYKKEAMNSRMYKEEPPKGAPQLPIENPGDQSDFPVAPSDSEIG
jgi:hypothetical protein